MITPAIIQQVEALTQKMNFPGFQYVKQDPHFVDWIIPQIENALGNGDPVLGTHLFLTVGSIFAQPLTPTWKTSSKTMCATICSDTNTRSFSVTTGRSITFTTSTTPPS